VWSASRPGRFTPKESTSYPLDRRLGAPHSRSERGGEEKNSHPLPALESPIIQRYTTELSNKRNLVTQNGVAEGETDVCCGTGS